MSKNALYAQSGGVTAVINASASGLIHAARAHPDAIGKVIAAKNGILGVLTEKLIDTTQFTEQELESLSYTPSGAFGSCRYKLKTEGAEIQRLINVFKAHNIAYFFYNGGGDSQDTALKIANASAACNYPITCIGIPKTIDNDLPYTDSCPGFGSVAKYVAISTLEASFDVASMAASSTKVFILEVMGRHAGWIAASAGLAGARTEDPPHIILFPEIAFVPELFLARVSFCVKNYGYCVIVAAEGIRTAQNNFLSTSSSTDAFGHAQLGGVAPFLAHLVTSQLKLKTHWALADYLQRAARHIASKTDLDQAYALGKAACELALKGYNAVMPIIIRIQDVPYRWKIGHITLAEVANQEKTLPPEFIREDLMGITQDCRRYLQPLIQGEAYPPYELGLPSYKRLQYSLLPKKLASFKT